MDGHCESTLTLQLAGRTDFPFGAMFCMSPMINYWNQGKGFLEALLD